MALLMLGGGVTDIRGSIGGTTFSRSGAGNYARARTKPVNPCSDVQETRRRLVSRCGFAWNTELDEADRQSWRDYANGTSWTNGLGQVITISGIAAFLRTAALKAIAGEEPPHEAPSLNGQGAIAVADFTATAATDIIAISQPPLPFDKNKTGDSLFVFQGLPSAPGRLAAPKHFKHLASIIGDAVTPPTFPTATAAVYLFTVGQRITLRWIRMDELGRVSVWQTSSMIAV
jgi:hypothetical protein